MLLARPSLFHWHLQPYAAVLHILVALWMFSEPTVLYSPQVFGGSSGSEVDSITGRDFSSAVSSLISGDQSSIGLMARLTRENTLPLFLLLLTFVGSWLLYKTVGRMLLALLRSCCFCLSGGRFCSREGAAVRQLQYNPPWTGPFTLPLDGSKHHELSRFEQLGGWRLARDAGFLVKLRVWPGDGWAWGMRHAKGERLLTWQVVALQGIASFDLAANPLYGAAAVAIGASNSASEPSRTGSYDCWYAHTEEALRSIISITAPSPLPYRFAPCRAGPPSRHG